MDYQEAFGFHVPHRKKKMRLKAMSSELILLKKQGATSKQLKQYVEGKTGMNISEDWLGKIIRLWMNDK